MGYFIRVGIAKWYCQVGYFIRVGIASGLFHKSRYCQVGYFKRAGIAKWAIS